MPETCEVGNYRYREEDVIGCGSFGKVYKGRSQADGGYVAIKLLSTDPAYRSDSEIRTLQTLGKKKASFVVRLIQSLPFCRNRIALIFELADGSVQDLLYRLEFAKGFPAPLTIQFYLQISTALHFIAENDFVHRDLKPANVLFWTLPSNRLLFKLGDFGGARIASNEMRSLVGTPGYACEAVINNILMGNVYSYSPVECEMWGLASMLYQVCCGRLPFEYQIPNFARKEETKLLETAKALSQLFADRKEKNIAGLITPNGKEYYDHLPLACQYPKSLRRILENLIRKLMNMEKPKNQDVVKSTFSQNLECAHELSSLCPHRIFHLHESQIVDFYPTSQVSHLQRSEVNSALPVSEVFGCHCENVELMLPSGRYVKLEELNRLKPPCDSSAISCVAFCYERNSKKLMDWQMPNIPADGLNDTMAAKALATYQAAGFFTSLLEVPQQVANFYGRSFEEFRVQFEHFHEHCSWVSTVIAQFGDLSRHFADALKKLIEQTGTLRKSRTEAAPFQGIFVDVKKKDFGQYDEERIVEIFVRAKSKQPYDQEVFQWDIKLLNNVRYELQRRTRKFSEKCHNTLGSALTDSCSPFEAHRRLDHFNEQLRTLSVNMFDELPRQKNIREAMEDKTRKGPNLDEIKAVIEKLECLANGVLSLSELEPWAEADPLN
ncbi:hypothetical protein L596_015194 [Steinernema carpocapsae]|uniref:IkappaB kinase n=1 Tax=Steinernema carpocapsae TaxID=34508 RepID=A0A4U5NEU4_STECR|nr:hypothetical protein L596_015194 [Steinernema carpocapsae]